MAMQKDLKGALDFAVERIAPYNRSALHWTVHTVGHTAYKLLQSRRAALGLLPENAFSENRYLIYEGYVHGVFMAYFAEYIKDTPVDDLVKESCGQFYSEAITPEDPSWRAGRQCFHGVGHALMYALKNQTQEALKVCERIPPWVRGNCAFGVFMELAYLYSPHYDPFSPKPDVYGESIAPFCKTAETFKKQCYMFIGRSYLNLHPHDYKGAFRSCGEDEPSGSDCRYELARIEITNPDDGVSTMKKRCLDAGPAHTLECFVTVAATLKMGNAGEAYRETDFCGILDTEFKEQCYKGVSAFKSPY